MSIPDNITKQHILSAIREIDGKGVPFRRNYRSLFLTYKGKRYPPKYLISLANKYANNEELDPNNFSSGDQTVRFLLSRGFIVEELHP